MSIEKCPVCGEKLWADGHGTPDGGIFFGMPTAGYCPKCEKFYRWASGDPVPDKHSTPSKISVSINGEKPVTIYKKKSPVFVFIESLFMIAGLIVGSPFVLFVFFFIFVIEKSRDILGFHALLFDRDEYFAFKIMMAISAVSTVGSSVAFALSHNAIPAALMRWYGGGTLIGMLLLITSRNFVRKTG